MSHLAVILNKKNREREVRLLFNEKFGFKYYHYYCDSCYCVLNLSFFHISIILAYTYYMLLYIRLGMQPANAFYGKITLYFESYM